MLVRQGIGDLVDLAVVLLVKHDTIYADDGYDSPVCLLQATKLQKFGKMLMLEVSVSVPASNSNRRRTCSTFRLLEV